MDSRNHLYPYGSAVVVSLLIVTAPVRAGGPGQTAAAPPSAQTQGAHAEPSRDSWQRVDDIVRELGIVAGSHVADVGAGGGFFTTRLAKVVGAEGRVYAVDVNPVSLRELKNALGPEVKNVELVRGDENDPHLPAGRLDGALVVNAYHEFAEYRAMLERLKTALKPGGRLVLVEPAPTRADDKTREAQAKRHTIDIGFAEADLKEVGFEIATRETHFTTRPEHQHSANGTTETIKAIEWLLTARKPAGPAQNVWETQYRSQPARRLAIVRMAGRRTSRG